MVKFKVGDRVSFTGRPNGETLEGVVCDAADEDGYVVVDVDAKCGYPVRRVWRGGRFLTLIEPKTPKPKTIPARNLSGKHIGRVVTITTESGAVVSDELTLACHDAATRSASPRVIVELKSVKPRNAEDMFGVIQFHLDPESEVIVK